MPSEPQARNSHPETLLLGAAIALAVLVRLPQIGASFYGDEGFSLLRDSNEWLTSTEDAFRPVFFTALHGWRVLGFHGEVGLRCLSLLFGVAQIPVAFMLGRRLAGASAGFVFALLLALDPLLIEFSQELRMYSLVPLLALLQAWAFVEVLARRSEHRPVLRAWVGFVAAGVLGTYSHFHYWFLIAGFGFALWRRRREVALKQGALALFATALLYLPNLPNVLRFQREGGGGAHLLATDLTSALPKLFTAFSVGFNYFRLPDMGLDRAIRVSSLGPNVALALLVAIPALIVCGLVVQACVKRRPGPILWLSIELLLVPIALSFAVVVATGKNFIHPKYMVFSAPFLPLLFTASYFATERRWLKAVMGVFGACVFAVALVHFNQPEQYGRREDWRGAALFLRTELVDQRAILLRLGSAGSAEQPPHREGAAPQSLWEYYAADLFERTRIISLPRPDVSASDLAGTVQRLTSGKRDVYYLWSEIGRNFDDPGDVVLAAARETLVDEQKRQFNPRFILYHWHTRQ